MNCGINFGHNYGMQIIDEISPCSRTGMGEAGSKCNSENPNPWVKEAGSFAGTERMDER